MLRFESGCTSFELVCSLSVVLYQLRAGLFVGLVVVLVGCRLLRDENWLVASASSWFLEGECLCKRKFRFFEVFEVGMVGGWVA